MGSTVAAIVLAAGAGSRFGGGKMLAQIQGRPILQHVLDRIAEAGIGDVVVVLGRDAGAVETAVVWRGEHRVVNEHPEGGLSSSLRLGMESLRDDVDSALILLGDQPMVRVETLRSIVAASSTEDRPVVVPAYDAGGARNPVLLRRAAFELVKSAAGDRGLGPVLSEHPELVQEVAMAGQSRDVDTRDDLARALLDAWADRVRANREQVEAIREVPDGADFYAPVHSLFRADPTRTDDPVLSVLLGLVEPGETWLDVGAGAGRFALPIARALAASGGKVIALDVSPSMLAALREVADEYGITNVETIEARWPAVPGRRAMRAEAGLIAHVGYDIEGIGEFLDAFESAVDRLCIAVLMARAPASAADPFWPLVHDQERVPLPGMPELLELLRAQGQNPVVRRVETEPRAFGSREVLEGFARRQLWIDPHGPKERRFQAALDELALRDANGWRLRDRAVNEIGIVTWDPRRGGPGTSSQTA